MDFVGKLYQGWWRGTSKWLCNVRVFHLFVQLSSLLQLFPLPLDHPLVQLFQIRNLNELHNPSENELQLCDRLLGPEFFPNSLWLMAMRAHVLYHLHGKPFSYTSGHGLLISSEFGQAEVQFANILMIDPERIDDIDIYSNILYVTGDQLKLSKLAHELLALDKDRPEVCCLIGT